MLSEHERDQAIKEGARNAADAAYFNGRPHLADDTGIRVFDAGFDRGWDAATAPLLARIAELEKDVAHKDAYAEQLGRELANATRELAEARKDAERLTAWREKIIKASEQAYGESAIRYKFSLTKNGKCINTFPKEIDGRWFALVPAEDDGHIGHIARIAELERELEEARKALEAARNWIAERPDMRQCSAGKIVAELTRALSVDEAIKEQT